MTGFGLLNVHDSRSHWGGELKRAAEKRGIPAKFVDSPDEFEDGYGFIRVHATPKKIEGDKALGFAMCDRLTMITDRTQIAVYDDKRAQIRLWDEWMPKTWVFTEPRMIDEFPVVSKADVGASSVNVRLIENREQLERHIEKIFSTGIEVNHCAGDGVKSLQKNYVILQRFIPHKVTYRVNAVGNQRAVFFRRCFKDRPMAQTGNTTPAYEMSDELESLLEYANAFFTEAGTKWCALDILKDGESWKLLETSLAWPHPSPGDCNNATFFPSGRKWIDMWDVLLDELSAFG